MLSPVFQQHYEALTFYPKGLCMHSILFCSPASRMSKLHNLLRLFNYELGTFEFYSSHDCAFHITHTSSKEALSQQSIFIKSTTSQHAIVTGKTDVRVGAKAASGLCHSHASESSLSPHKQLLGYSFKIGLKIRNTTF